LALYAQHYRGKHTRINALSPKQRLATEAQDEVIVSRMTTTYGGGFKTPIFLKACLAKPAFFIDKV
jgi:hypothetical protein